MEETRQEDIWIKFLGKQVSVNKLVNQKQLFYRGIITDVLSDKVIIDDRKLGKIPLTFDGLSFISLNDRSGY